MEIYIIYKKYTSNDDNLEPRIGGRRYNMVDNDKLSQIEKRADEVLKEHNAVYLERRLYNTLKREFPGLSRADFREVLNELLNKGYVMEHGLIKPLTDKNRPKGYIDDEKPGKGAPKPQRIPDKRL